MRKHVKGLSGYKTGTKWAQLRTQCDDYVIFLLITNTCLYPYLIEKIGGRA